MRISDRYERFNDRVQSPATGAAKASKETSAVADKTAAVASTKGGEPGVLTVSVSARAAQLSASSTRLQELKEQVKNGTYKVDAQAIAKSLVGDD
jgi:anti-sigma28 factor (negative regulator of flagellin synthesis)